MAKKTEEQENKTVAPTKEQETKTAAPSEVQENKTVAPAEEQETKTAVPVEKDAESEMVEIQLFKDAEKYSSDVTVVVNGKVYQIQRGVKVRVPRFVAEVLENQTRQDNATADLIEREATRFKAQSEARGL